MSGECGKWEGLVTIPTGGWDLELEEYVAADVAWQDATAITIAGDRITRDAPGGDWTSSARSVATLAANGIMEWTAHALGVEGVFVGLTDTDTGYATMDYTWRVYADLTADVYEDANGGYQSITFQVAVGEKLRIQAIGNVVTYWHLPAGGSWTLKHTSATARPAGALMVDAAIYTAGVYLEAVDLYTGDGGTTVSLTAAKTYYHSSAGNDTLDLPARLAALLSAAATGTYTASVAAGESGTGLYAITEAGAIPFTIVWTDTDLRDLLGFTANLGTGSSGILTTYTGTASAQGLWLPDGPPLSLTTAFNDELDESDRTVVESPNGVYSHSLAYNRKRVITDLVYQGVSRRKTRAVGETYANESWQSFWRDVIDGDESGYLTIGRVRIYPDADTDSTYYDYWVGASRDCTPRSMREGWQLRWVIPIPRLVRVET